MSVRSSRSAAEAAQRQHPRLRAFHDAMAHSMQAFEKAREWPDLIKCLARVNKVLAKFSHIDHLPMTLTVTKRLAQCLNSVLPGGVHLKTLETYRVILERIGPQRLVQDLSLYSTGLFPLFSYASTRVKPELLEIYEKFYLPLGKGLMPCLTGLVLALLPGLEEGSGEVYSRTLTLLVNIRDCTSAPHFALALWRCVLQSGKVHRAFAVRFITATIPPAGSDELPLYLPTQKSIAIEAIVAALHDEEVLTQRSMFDLMISHFPLVESIFTKKELSYLLQATLPVILRRETSVNRRFYSWLLSKGTNGDIPSSAPLDMPESALEMITISLCQIMAVHSVSVEGATQPFNIARTLLERDEIRMSKFLCQITVALIDYAYSYNSNASSASQPVLKSAQLFFNQADLSQVWSALISAFCSSLNAELEGQSDTKENIVATTWQFSKIHTIELIDFALDFLPVHFESTFSETRVLPLLVDTALKALYKHSWEAETPEMTRLSVFTLKRLMTRQHFAVSLSESDSFLAYMALPSLPNIEVTLQSHDEVQGCSHVSNMSATPKLQPTESMGPDQGCVSCETEVLHCTRCLCDLFHQLIRSADRERSKHVARFSQQLLVYASSTDPEVSCLGFESWMRLIEESFKEPQQMECAILAKQLWYLLDPKFSDRIHRRAAKLWLQLYDICPNLCESVAADAMLNLPDNEQSNERDGYERFARLWHFLSPLDLPENQSRCSGNSLSIMLDAIDDQRTPIRMIALEFIRVSSDHIYRVLDPLLLILLCPTTLRLCPSLCYANKYDTSLVRHVIWRLQAIFSSVHRQLAASKSSQQVVLNPTILSLLRRHERPAGNLPSDQRFPLPDAPTYLDVLLWCGLRFVQSRMQIDVSEKDIRANEDVRLSAVDLLVQLITASALIFNDIHSTSMAFGEKVANLGIAALNLLHLSISSQNSNMQISLLRLLRHVLLDNSATNQTVSTTKLLGSANFVSTILYGIQQANGCNSEQHLLQHWIGFVISILSNLQDSLGSIAFSVLTVVCEQVRKTSINSCSAISVLLYGIREIVHFCLLKRPTPLTLASQLSTANVNTGNNTTVFGFLGGIFSSANTRDEPELPFPAESIWAKETPSSSSAIQGILPLIVDVILYVWSLPQNKSFQRKKSASSVSSMTEKNLESISFEISDLVISFLNPLFIECPVFIVNAFLSSWEAHAKQHENDMSIICSVIDALPAANPDCILSTLNAISVTTREHPTGSAPATDLKNATMPHPSDTSMLHFLDQYIRCCKTSSKLTESWPKLLQLQKTMLSGASSALIPPALWLISIIHEFSLRTAWQKLDSRLLKDIRDMVQGLYTSSSNMFVKGSTETVIGNDSPKPFALFSKTSVSQEISDDDDCSPTASWLLSPGASHVLTLRLLALRLTAIITADILSLICGGSSLEEEERTCSLLSLLLPYIFLNIDNRALDQVEYAAASVTLISSFSVKKFKYTLKTFRKDSWNSFQHNDFFDSSVDGLVQWRKILSQIVTEDPLLVTEQLMGRPINPQVLMFTSHKTDVLSRARQLKRLSFMIHAGRIDEYARHLPVIVEKLVESLKLEDANLLYTQVLFCIRILLARVSPENLHLIWPVVLMEVISVLDECQDLDLILEACKFVDLALVLLPSQFLLYQWMFILDRLANYDTQSNLDPETTVNSRTQVEEETNKNTEDDDIIKLCSYNTFNCFQPHVGYLSQRLATEPAFANPSSSADSTKAVGAEISVLSSSEIKSTLLRRPILTMRKITSPSQLRQFHSEVSDHLSSDSVPASPPDLEFIDQLLLSDFVSFGDGYESVVT